jgi:GMP synthase PP-ATPase subunit
MFSHIDQLKDQLSNLKDVKEEHNKKVTINNQFINHITEEIAKLNS